MVASSLVLLKLVLDIDMDIYNILARDVIINKINI